MSVERFTSECGPSRDATLGGPVSRLVHPPACVVCLVPQLSEASIHIVAGTTGPLERKHRDR
jgi:hypothetical protein